MAEPKLSPNAHEVRRELVQVFGLEIVDGAGVCVSCLNSGVVQPWNGNLCECWRGKFRRISKAEQDWENLATERLKDLVSARQVNAELVAARDVLNGQARDALRALQETFGYETASGCNDTLTGQAKRAGVIHVDLCETVNRIKAERDAMLDVLEIHDDVKRGCDAVTACLGMRDSIRDATDAMLKAEAERDAMRSERDTRDGMLNMIDTELERLGFKPAGPIVDNVHHLVSEYLGEIERARTFLERLKNIAAAVREVMPRLHAQNTTEDDVSALAAEFKANEVRLHAADAELAELRAEKSDEHGKVLALIACVEDQVKLEEYLETTYWKFDAMQSRKDAPTVRDAFKMAVRAVIATFVRERDEWKRKHDEIAAELARDIDTETVMGIGRGDFAGVHVLRDLGDAGVAKHSPPDGRSLIGTVVERAANLLAERIWAER